MIRSLADPRDAECVVLPETRAPQTCAQFSPNGEWIASGDASGAVRVWGAVGEHTVKSHVGAVGGAVEDVAWDADGTRLVAGGQGKSGNVKAFAWDTGSNLGEFMGIGSSVNSVAFRPKRPFRIVTAGEDGQVGLFGGPPFKFSGSHKEHTKAVNCVRYSPDGERFVTVSGDKNGVVWAADDAAKVCELVGHEGTVYAASWSPDGTQLLTCSSDKTAKLWDVGGAAATAVSTFAFGTELEEMQVGCVWLGEHLVTASLSGTLNFLDPADPVRPRLRVPGHTKFVTALAAASERRLYSASYEGIVCEWSADRRSAYRTALHGSRVNGLQVVDGRLVSSSVDSTLKVTDLPLSAGGAGAPTTLDVKGTPAGSSTCAATGVTATVTSEGVKLFRDGAELSTSPLPYKGTCCALAPGGAALAVGGGDNKVHLYVVDGAALMPDGELEKHRGEITCLGYSPDGSLLASADALKECVIWNVATKDIKMSRMAFHSARVQALAWCPDNVHLATGSLDWDIIVWNSDLSAFKRKTLPRAHSGGVTALAWLDEHTLASAGSDVCIRFWEREAAS